MLAELRAHYTTHATPTNKEEEEERWREQRTERVVLDGGGARLADAATRHHLTQTNKRRGKRGEQNKHQGTQTIQKTSTRTSTTDGHHTLPSMRNQTPIQQQRTTQTQLSRGRPHNPSLARRIQSSRQRASPLRQMQQQTRQRTKRQRQSTPLPKKRRRKRQTTHRSHANTTHRHMVNHTPPFQTQKGGARRKARNGEERTQQRETQWCSGITCVLARLRAHYPEHQHKEEEGKRGRGHREEEDKQRDHTPQQDNTHHNT